MLLKELKNNYIYLERYINNFKKIKNEVSKEYCAVEGKKEFYLPYLILPSNLLKIFIANPSNKIKKVILKEYIPFFIHPETLDNKINDFMLTKKVQPTSSTRTVLPTENNEFAIKLHLNKRISKFIRRLRTGSIEHSILISSELEKAKNPPSSFGYLPESIGVSYKGIGFIIREMIPRPFIKEKRILVPLFSFYSTDLKNKNHKPIFIQLVKKQKKDPLKFFINNIIDPLFNNISYFINNHGILLEPHAQNVLVELDKNFKIKRLIHRDFQSIYIDQDIRKYKKLPKKFKKHIMGEECLKEISYSLVYDQYIGRYVLDNFVNIINKEFKIEKSEIQERIKKVFLKYFDKKLFPKKGYYKMKKTIFYGNKTEFEKINKNPRYRP